MYRLPLIIILLLLSTIGINAQERPMANPADVATIDGVMKAYYEGVSGPPGKWDGERIYHYLSRKVKSRLTWTAWNRPISSRKNIFVLKAS